MPPARAASRAVAPARERARAVRSSARSVRARGAVERGVATREEDDARAGRLDDSDARARSASSASTRAVRRNAVVFVAAVVGVALAGPASARPGKNHATARASASFERFVGVDRAERLTRAREKRNSFVRDAANAIGPAVVRIDSDAASLKRATGVNGGVSGERGGGKSSTHRSGVIRGTGCGLVIDAVEGYVVTNSHVVKSEEKVKVTFIDGNVYDGEVKGVDALTDIALIKLRPRAGHALPVARLGNSDHVEVGDYAIALGNPLGLDNSVTLGIISNVHRTSAELGITDRRVDFVQTDCAINPGNSGGPLVNEFSEVVALNTAIRADAEGIGFAIPINTVKRVVSLLANGEKVPHPFIGIRMVDNFTANSAFGDRAQELPVGTVIVDIIERSPAALAGLAIGDVITAVDGVVMSGAQILNRVKGTTPGDSFEFTVFRPSAQDSHMHRRVIIRVGDLAEHNNRSKNVNAEDRNISPPGVGVRPPRIPRTFGA